MAVARALGVALGRIELASLGSGLLEGSLGQPAWGLLMPAIGVYSTAIANVIREVHKQK